MNCLLIAAVVLLLSNGIKSSPPYFTYRTLRYRMMDGSFRRPYRLPSSSVLLGNNWMELEAPSSTVRVERKRLPYYHGFGKGR